MAAVVAAVLVSMLWLGCESAPAPTRPAQGPTQPAARSGTPLERLFPLVDRAVYQYAVESDEGQDILLARVSRHGPTTGSLQLPGGIKEFEYVPDGVKLLSREWGPVYVLKQPLELHNRWRGEHGGTVEVVRVDAVVNVPAGRYEGCVQTLEQRGGDRPIKVATTFCPDVGIVVLEAASGAALERAELKSYGPPVDLGPDGVRRIE